jgi:hypothetical protein
MTHSARPVSHPLEDLGQLACLIGSLSPVACLAQSRLDGIGGLRDSCLFVCEQVDVLGWPADDAVGDQCIAAAEGEPVPCSAQGNFGYVAVQPVQASHAAVAARSCGC